MYSADSASFRTSKEWQVWMEMEPEWNRLIGGRSVTVCGVPADGETVYVAKLGDPRPGSSAKTCSPGTKRIGLVAREVVIFDDLTHAFDRQVFSADRRWPQGLRSLVSADRAYERVRSWRSASVLD
jgi:hypothetical protein